MHIHWHEGLFLQPQHFQCMQRGFHEALRAQMHLIAPWPFGVVEARIADDALAAHRLRFDALRIVMPSGLEINAPEDTDLPELDLKPVLLGTGGSVLILLGIPKWEEKRQNALKEGDDTRAKMRYRVVQQEVVDENTGGNPKTLLTRRFNARLLSEREDTTGLETMPVARLTLGAGENIGRIRLDPDYAPPCLFLRSSPRLQELVSHLVDQVQGSHQELLAQLNRSALTMETLHGHQFEQVLRLRTLSRFAARLTALLRAGDVTPFAWYLELREMLGELTALKLGEESFDSAAYDHLALFHTFSDMEKRVRRILRTAVQAAFTKVEFRKESGWYATSLTEEQATKPVDYLLAIKTSQDYAAVRQLVTAPARFKVLPSSWAEKVIFGVKLDEVKNPPHFLPNQPGLHYFRLLRSESKPIWDRIQQECELIVRFTGHGSSEFQITLYLVLDN